MRTQYKNTAFMSESQKIATIAALFDELDQIEKDAAMGWFGRKVVAPLAIAGGLAGGGAKLVSHLGAKAPAAVAQVAERSVGKVMPMGAGGMMGGRTRAGQDALRAAGM